MTTKTVILAALCGLSCCALGQSGLQGEYFNGKQFEEKILTRTDPQINFSWFNKAPAPGVNPHVFSVRWTGFLQTPESGTYRFRAFVDDGIRVYVNGKLVIDAWDLHDTGRFSGEIYLEAGRKYPLKVEYFNAMFEGEIKLQWQLPSEKPLFDGYFGYNDRNIETRYLTPPPKTSPEKPKPVPVERKEPTTTAITPKPAPAPVQEKPAPVEIPADTLETYIPKNILFVKSKAIMLPPSEPELDKLAGFLTRNPHYKLVVEGHTDRIGNSDKNMILSKERAQTVAAYLTKKGIAASRITAFGYGDTRPLIREPEGVANPKNRRVAFLIRE
ncbi:MAG: PA14 domain-containing protein [Saprospiraceae bacterium]